MGTTSRQPAYSAEQLIELAHANAAIRNGRTADARRRYADAGIPVTAEIELEWAATLEKDGNLTVAHDCYTRVYESEPSGGAAAVRADAGIRRCCVARGDLDKLRAWLKRPNWDDINAPTHEELRAIARYHLKTTRRDDKSWAIVRGIARELNDHALLRRMYHHAVRRGDWRMAEEIAADLGHPIPWHDRVRIARILIGCSTDSRRDRTFAIEYIVAHRLRMLTWPALLDGAESQGWRLIRARAKRLRFRLTTAYLRMLLQELRGGNQRKEILAVLNELARRSPRRWRRELRDTLAAWRTKTVRCGEVPAAAWCARVMRKPLTVAECTALLAANEPKEGDPPFRHEYRKQIEVVLRAAAEREAKAPLPTTPARAAA